MMTEQGHELNPPVGDCPEWCEKPRGHDWEDLWLNGVIRYHTWRRQFTAECQPGCIHEHAIGVDEIEQHTPTGTVRQRRVVLDVESPTDLDVPTAQRAVEILQEAIALAADGLPDGQVN